MLYYINYIYTENTGTRERQESHLHGFAGRTARKEKYEAPQEIINLYTNCEPLTGNNYLKITIDEHSSRIN